MTVFQMIRLPDIGVCTQNELYYHIYDVNDKEVCFDGFFNLFDVGIRKKYTTISSLRLRLVLNGKGVITLMHNNAIVEKQGYTDGENIFEFPYDKYQKGAFWFKLAPQSGEALSGSIVSKGVWEGECSSSVVRIAIVICTYKRERELCDNLGRLFGFYPTDRFFDVFVTDNGNTLKEYPDMDALIKSNENLYLTYNRNYGGAGGYTRGMIEVLSRIREGACYSHVLVMDDDAIFDPELFVRLRGFVGALDRKYRNLTVGSSLFRLDRPATQQVCGEFINGYSTGGIGVAVDMSDFANCIAAMGYESDRTLYSAWRLCCYPMSIVRSDNLPFPFFLHYDDAEYGLRNSDAGCVFFNGISVWHRVLDMVEHGVFRYYDTRNAMIYMSISDGRFRTYKALLPLFKKMIYLVLEYRYNEAELIYNGFLDFCKGAEWFMHADPEVINRSLIQWNKGRMVKAERVYSGMDVSIEKIRDNGFEKKEKSRIDIGKLISLNGLFLGTIQDEAVLTTMDSPFKAYRAKKVVIVDPSTNMGNVYGRSRKGSLKCLKMMVRMLGLGLSRHGIPDTYRSHYKYMTSEEFWKDYLGLSSDN